MKGIQDFAASKVRNQNYNQKRLSIDAKCKVRLPELPLEVWGPFVFVLADAASGGGVSSVKVQLQAIQVNCSVTTACGDHGRNYSFWRELFILANSTGLI